jgi:hypothetical protein
MPYSNASSLEVERLRGLVQDKTLENLLFKLDSQDDTRSRSCNDDESGSGNIGSTGAKGDTGTKGDTGIQGPTGDTGPGFNFSGLANYTMME